MPPQGVESRAFFGPFIGPGWPITPVQPGEEPRYFDYVSGVNSNVTPRTEYSTIPSFASLWLAYVTMPILRVAVTFRTQQIQSLAWKLQPRRGSGFRANGAGLRTAQKLIDMPDPQNGYNFEAWLRSVLEEVYVTDALTIYPVRSRMKTVVALLQLDGQTIKPLLDYKRGGIPVPPAPAYVQYIKGSAFTSFTSNQLIYKPFRPRVWCIYGQSRVENVFQTAVLYTLHENWTSDFFTQGNQPETAYLVSPDEAPRWDAKKHKEWQELMDEQAGVNVGRRRVHLVPPWVKEVKALKPWTFERNLPDWLVRLICIEFGVPSYLFTAETNRATAKEMNTALYDAPLRQDLQGSKRLMDRLLLEAGYAELEFQWRKNLDYSKEAVEGMAMMVERGIVSQLRAAEILGMEDEEAGTEDTEQTREAAEAEPDGADEGAEGETKLATVVQLHQKQAGAPRSGGRKGRRFVGRGAGRKAALSTGLAKVVMRRMRQQKSQIMEEGLARARARGRKVIGV